MEVDLKENLEETVASLDELKQQLVIETTTKQLQDIKTVESHVSASGQVLDENAEKMEVVGQKNIQELKNKGIISRCNYAIQKVIMYFCKISNQ